MGPARPDALSASFGRRPLRLPRALPWAALVALLLVAQSALVWLTLDHEAGRMQERTDDAAAQLADELRRQAQRDIQQLQALANGPWQPHADELLAQRPGLLRLERRDAHMALQHATDAPAAGPGLFVQMPRQQVQIEAEITCALAARGTAPQFSRSYFVPTGNGLGQEVVELCLPVQAGGRHQGFVVATLGLAAWLDAALARAQLRDVEASLVEGDGARLARAGAKRGAAVFVATRLVNLPGSPLQLRVDAVAGRPSLIPNLATALVLGLSVALFGVVLLLARDVRRRARAEAALAEALAVRKAMEDSLVTGLRARDLQGRVTYANPAFRAMVGFSTAQLRATDPPPYWPPERVQDFRQRQAERAQAGLHAPREGYESEFMRASGERFPVMVYDAPLVDHQGRHTGWMSAVVDITEQRRVEELSRQQQERLAATARLATVGEMASLLSHEINQPLAAIASYAGGSLNLMDDPDASADPAQLRQALARIAEQAERAGRVIKSVHDFVRRREQPREPVAVGALVDAVLPLARLQARKSGTRIELDLADPTARVVADRTMVEQVLLNLTRNGMQAMDTVPPAQRLLTLRSRSVQGRWLALEVADRGPGIAPEVAQRLFTPFFTTRAEGMGLGLSLCRTVVEQHGGALDFDTRPGGGTVFRFTLPLATAAAPQPHDTAQDPA